MKAKKILTALTALLIIMNLNACQDKPSVSDMPSESDTVSEEVSPVKLKNFMTEKERNSVKTGVLTLLDDKKEETSGEHTVEIVWWTTDDYRKWFKEEKERLFSSEEEYEKVMKDLDEMDKQGYKTETIYKVLIDGREYTGWRPPKDYDGGKLEFYLSDTSVQPDIKANSFEEFKPLYRDMCNQWVEEGMFSQAEADQNYEDMLIIFQSVIDGTYNSVTKEYVENRLTEIQNENEIEWEFNRDEITAIKDSVRQISMYDEEMERYFTVHVTLPPDFDEEKTYPMFVMTDGIWRFGNCPSMRKLMENGEAQDVILVTINYNLYMYESFDSARGYVLVDQKELMTEFVTNNLMPYLNELYNIDFEHTGLYGHSDGGVFTHYAAFNSDLFENQPFKYYIIGSPAFWGMYLGDRIENPDAYKNEYGYFDRNNKLDKILYVCGGENEDPVYEERYGENESTLEGIESFMNRMESHGVTTAECKIYENSGHYEFIPDMFIEFFHKFYGK